MSLEQSCLFSSWSLDEDRKKVTWMVDYTREASASTKENYVVLQHHIETANDVAISRNSFTCFLCVGEVIVMQGSQSISSTGEFLIKLNRRAKRDEGDGAELESTHLVLKEAGLCSESASCHTVENGPAIAHPIYFLHTARTQIFTSPIPLVSKFIHVIKTSM